MQTGCTDTAEVSKETPSVKAVLGKDTILPCYSELDINLVDDIVEWSKDNDEIYTVDNRHRAVQQEQYKDRVSIPIEELKKRNASLNLSGVKQEDGGKYCCCIKRGRKRNCTSLILEVKMEEQQKNITENPNNQSKIQSPGDIGTTPSPRAHTNKDGEIIGIIVGGVFILVLVVAVVLTWRNCKPQSREGTGRKHGDGTSGESSQSDHQNNAPGPSEDDRVNASSDDPNPSNPAEQEDVKETENLELKQNQNPLPKKGTTSPRYRKSCERMHSKDDKPSPNEDDGHLTSSVDLNPQHRD